MIDWWTSNLVPDIDLASDEAWEPVFNPYQGRVTPMWQITQDARFRMGYVAKTQRAFGEEAR